MKILLSAAIVFSAFTANAMNQVKCFENGKPQNFVVVAMDEIGRIQQAGATEYVLVDQDPQSTFAVIGGNFMDGRFQAIVGSDTPDHDSVATFLAGDEVIRIGVSQDRKAGYLARQNVKKGGDIVRLPLICQTVK
jgi:hypothetical protein